jgi:hypothetical protein
MGVHTIIARIPCGWPAGHGTRGTGHGARGTGHGATDPLGRVAVDGKVHIHDLHATILHQLGMDHEQLTYHYAGRDFRVTDVAGEVVRDILV